MKTFTSSELDHHRDWMAGFQSNDNIVKRINEDLQAVYYFAESIRRPGYWWVLAFSGKRSKPDANYIFSNQATLLNFVESWLGGLRRHQYERMAKQALRKNFKTTLRVGDILTGSWGYDQTNIEFYQVIKQQGNRVVIRALRRTHNFEKALVEPLAGMFTNDPPETKIVQPGDIVSSRLYILEKWDGKPRYETPFGEGH